MRRLALIGLLFPLIFLTCSKPAVVKDQTNFDKGLAALAAGNPDEALKIFRQLTTTDASSPDGAYGEALTFDAEGLLYEAISSYQNLIAKEKDFVPALRSLAILSHRAGLDGLCVSMLDQYRKAVGDSASILALRADALISLGYYKDAETAVNEGLSKFPDDPEMQAVAAKYYLHSGNPNKSRQLIDEARDAGSDLAGPLNLLGEYYALMGQTDSAAQYYEKSLQADKDNFYHKADIAEKLLAIGYDYPAETLTDQLLKTNGKSHRAIMLKSSIFKFRGKSWNALDTYGAAAVVLPNSPTVLSHEAIFYYDVYNSTIGETYMNNAIDIIERDSLPVGVLVDVQLNWIRAMEKTGANSQTPMLLRMLIGAFPQDYQVIEMAAQIYLKYAPPDSTRKMLEIFEQAIANNPVRLAEAGGIYARADSASAATRCFFKALEIDKISYASMIGQASLYVKQDGSNTAIAFLEKQGEPAASYPLIANDKITYYSDNRQWDRALNIAERQAGLGPRDLNRFRTAINLAIQINDKERALKLIKQCVDFNSGIPAGFALAGEFYIDIGKADEAAECLSKATALDSLSVPGFILEARLDTLQGRYDDALRTYRRAIAADQYAGEAIDGLATVLIEKKNDYANAANEMSSAIATDPSNPKFHMTQGWAYYKMGRYDLARGSFEKALKFDPRNPLINYYAGINYFKDKKPNQAGECLRKALAGKLPDRLRSEAENTLRDL
ncbi:exported hypothetical protein [Candidatus Zixiibacteriota bacterium]|nr:exported hypothetical protein [candidate division Zixibacteria bacterium]